MALCRLSANSPHLINPACSDGRAIDKILEEEIVFPNSLWSFCEN